MFQGIFHNHRITIEMEAVIQSKESTREEVYHRRKCT